MNKRLIVLVMVMALLVSTSVVFAQITDVTIPDDLPSGITVTYWHEWDGAQGEAINIIIDDFNTNNPWGITVEQVPLGGTGDVQDQMSTAIVSGDLPNLVGATFVTNAQGYYLDGVLVPLDAYYNHPMWGFTEEEIADLNQGLLDINRPPFPPINGQLLAWPSGMSGVVLSVNLEMLAELGYDGPPTTMEEFHDIACAANELTGPNGEDVQGFPIRISASDMWSFIYSNGGYIWDEDAQQYDFTNENAISTLQFFQDLYNEGCAYIPDGPFVNTADFAFGLNPMAVGSSVGVPFIKGDIEDSGSGIENWINTTTPWSGDNRTLQVGMRGTGLIVSSPEEQLASWLFLKHMASTQSNIVWTEYTQYQPYTYSALNELSQEFLDANLQFSTIREVLLGGEVRIWSRPPLASDGQMVDAFEEMLASILTGGEDVATAAAAAQETANEALAEVMEEMG